MVSITDRLTRIFGSKNERELKRIAPLVDQINSLEAETRSLSDAELTGATARFRERLDGGATLDELLPEAFAVVREASVRTLGVFRALCRVDFTPPTLSPTADAISSSFRSASSRN